MKHNWTKQEILDSKGCYSSEQVEKLSFINNDVITLVNILESEISIKDKRWFLYNNGQLSLDQKKALCLKMAYAVLPIYEAKYPDDKRVRDCLQGIEDYNNGKISVDELRKLRSDAYDAYAAADAADAYAAYAAADAAYAAAYAAYADAAYAAAYAAADAAYADADADASDTKTVKYSTILNNILIDFCKKYEE